MKKIFVVFLLTMLLAVSFGNISVFADSGEEIPPLQFREVQL